MLAGKYIVTTGYGNKEKGIKQGDWTAKASYGSSVDF